MPPVRRRTRSLERSLPLLIVGLLALVILLFAAWSWIEVRGGLLRAQQQRMAAAAADMGAQIESMARLRNKNAEDLARGVAELAACLTAPDEATIAAAREALHRSSPGRDSVVELWDLAGRRLFKEAVRLNERSTPAVLATVDGVRPERSGIQPFRLVDGVLSYDAVAEVRAPPTPDAAASPAQVLGHVVQRRSLHTSKRAIEMLSKLLGREVTLLVGNEGGDSWSDLTAPRSGPSMELFAATAGSYVAPDGLLRVGAGRKLDGTPWIVWVESDAAVGLEPSRTMVWRMAVVVVLLLVLGGTAGWWASRRITRPLQQVTAAAEAVAVGDFQPRLEIDRNDEIGRLATAFASMAGQVGNDHRLLEEKVERRTAELQHTLQQLRATQEELVRKEKLALLGQLAGGISHELRNPLGVMSNAIYFLNMIQPGAPAQVRDYLDILREQVGLSESIVNGLLDFARSRPPQPQAVSLPALLDTQLARVGTRHVAVEREFEPDLRPAWVDPVQTGQVLYNLLLNAVQAMGPQPGTITLRLRAAGDRLQLEVSDTGPGVPEELVERIFEPLFTTRPRGIGLGLAVSRRLVEGNGGELRCLHRSNGGSGATFVLVLPSLPDAA